MKNNLSPTRLIQFLVSIVVMMLLSMSQSYANDDTSGTAASCGGIDCLIAGYGSNVRKQLVKLPTDSEIILDTQKIQINLHQLLQATSFSSLIDSTLQKIYPTDSNEPGANYLYTFDPAAGDLCSNPKSSFNPACKIQPLMSIKNVNFSTFYGSLVYDDAQKAAAQKFIQSATLQSLPIKQADIAKMLQNDSGQPGSDYTTFYNTHETLKKYLAVIRQYTTIQATAISNLMREYNERLPISEQNDEELKKLVSELSKKPNSNLPADTKQISRLYLQHYLATRRITDPNWYKDLASNNPAMLERQMVMLQAENLAETYRLRMAIDRLTTTMSVAMMQSAYNQQIQVEALRNQLNQEIQKETSPR